ncbi:MAG: phosphoglycerate kinase [Chloroflexi bacterium]|nr:phosphoglycerate kinase [Chloroflexota bacterium]
MVKQTVKDIDVRGKRVLVRVDYNVPLDKATGSITDDGRIRATLPTLRYLIQEQAKIILVSHLGRPEGKVVDRLRLDGVARRLSQLLGQEVGKTNDCVGPEVEAAVKQMKEGDVILLENLRFHAEEESNDLLFAQSLAGLADIYVNDAFATAHRAHASTAGVARYLPAVAGFLMEKELAVLGELLGHPQHPFAAIIGGAKVSTKMGVLENLLGKVDSLLLGGGMACTFLKSQGYSVGRSAVENEQLNFAAQLLKQAQAKGVKVLLPIDVVVGDDFAADTSFRAVAAAAVPPQAFIMDIGPQTVRAFSDQVQVCQTILWNGPMGVYEFPPFAQGTRSLASLLAQVRATTIVGGGETAAAVEELGLAGKITHVSTGGGATLEFLEGKTLPGVAALLDKV